MRRLLIGATLTFALIGCGDDSGDDDDDTGDGAIRADAGGGGGDAGRDAGGGGMDASTDAGGGNIDSGTDAARPADASIPTDAARSDASTTDAGGGLDSGAADAGGDGGPETFASLYTSIFMANCSGCHGSNHRSGLDLSSAQAAYDALINKAPGTGEQGAGSVCKTSGLLRVTPNNAAASLLVAKIEPSPPCGARMPINRDALSGEQIARVRAWVTAGAPR